MIIGLIGKMQQILTGLKFNFIIFFTACETTSIIGTWFFDKYFGRLKSILAPYFFDILIIFLSFEETITSSKIFDFRAS